MKVLQRSCSHCPATSLQSGWTKVLTDLGSVLKSKLHEHNLQYNHARGLHMAQVLYQSGSGHTAQPMEGSRSVADRQQQSRLLLSVHAAAHEEALHAISLAAAASDVALHPR